MNFKVDFRADGDKFVGYDVTISQASTGKSFTISKDGDYLAALSFYLKQGMVIQVSQIAGDPDSMDYLNHSECSEECSADDRFKMGDLTIVSPDKIYPDSEPALDAYVWEAAPWDTHMCPDLDTDDCKYSWRCIGCRGSYPVGDPAGWHSDDYKCRCHAWDPYPDPFEERSVCPFYE